MTEPGAWQPHHPGRHLSIESSEVHVWRASLDVPAARAQALEESLEQDERRRARRFRWEHDRRRHVVHRASLRAILSAYLGPETALRISQPPGSKPIIEGETGERALRFSATHSDGLGLYSVSRGLETGVDVERIESSLARPQIADQYFAASDLVRLGQMTAIEYPSEFFRCWTRLEAQIKASGHVPGGPAADLGRWTVHQLSPGPGYAGALAVEGSGCRITCWDFQWP